MQNQTIERTTLSNLIHNEEYSRKVLPFIKPEYFDVREERIIFDEIQKFVDKYNKIPNQTSLEIECKQGSLLMFPPMWPWLHAGTKPINESKYIMQSYLHYV